MLASASLSASRIVSFTSGCILFCPHGVFAMFNMECPMADVKVFVRNGLIHDGPKFDPGLDTNFDFVTGEELPDDLRIMTKQQFKDECDVNHIMRRYETTGRIDHINERSPSYGDFSNVASYQDAVNIVLAAEEAFSELSAQVRDRFGNDPEKFLEFINDPKNIDEAVELGLATKPVEPLPTKVEVINPAPPLEPTAPKPKDA